MNLANKITISRLFLTVIIVLLLLFPFESAGISFTNLFINELIVVNVKYLIAGILFAIALLTDYLDGYVAKKYNIITENGKMLDNLVDKMLIDSVLIVLSSQGFLHSIIPILVIGRDCVVNAIRMAALRNEKTLKSVKTGKAKNIMLKIVILSIIFIIF